MKNIALFASLAIFFVACKDNRSKDLSLTQPGTLNTQLSSSQSTTGTTAQFPAGSAVTGLKTNPEHGQPGHRCELAVGAPLPGSAASPVSTSQPAQQVTTTTQPVSTTIDQLASNVPALNTPAPNTKTAAGLNPAHGQPGHRCEIAVGAPLSSAAPAKTSNSLQNVSVQPVNSPVPATATAPGMNPQHGQPGHRCEIAVGAPLNSAPAKIEEKKDSAGK